MERTHSAGDRSVCVPFGGDVEWPATCCVCPEPWPDAHLRLEAYDFRWLVPASWQTPVGIFEVPICRRCRQRRVLAWMLRGLVVLLVLAGSTFALAMSGRDRWIVEWDFLVFGPILLWLWWRFPVGPTIRFAEGSVVMTFRREEFARAVVVHPPSELPPEPVFVWRK